MVKILFTFDCEDFVNDRSLTALYQILELLGKYEINGIFFLTGHMAEKIGRFSRISELLNSQEIGYHSTSHSIRPTIIEYSDVESYSRAREISLERETRHINPITGKEEGIGGINVLNEQFPNKEILAFRAPGFSHSPPHLEALKEFGIRYDFSTNLSKEPINYKNMTFYPYPELFEAVSVNSYLRLIKKQVNRSVVVFDFHPNMFVNEHYWDLMYFKGNPKKLVQTNAKKKEDIESNFRKFELLLKRLKHIEKSGMLKITSQLEKGEKVNEFDHQTVEKSYNESIKWVKEFFRYHPKHVFNHFKEFFSMEITRARVVR